MASILDVFMYVVLMAHKTRKHTIENAAFDTRITFVGMLAMSLSFVPNCIVLNFIPQYKAYIENSSNAVIKIIIILILPIATFTLTYYFGFKRYSEDYVIAIYRKYGDRISNALAIIIMLLMGLFFVCFVLFMMIYSIVIIA